MNNKRIKRLDFVVHFEHELHKDDDVCNYVYIVVGFGNHSETGELLVIYRELHEPYNFHLSPYDVFMSEVDHEKYPNVKQKYVFDIFRNR